MSIDLFIWLLLGALALSGVYMSVERILFHLSRREIDPVELQSCLRQRLPRNPQLRSLRRRHWLDRLLQKSSGDRSILRRMVEFEIRMTSRYQSLLATIASVAMTVGLLGTVASMYLAGSGGEDMTKLLGLGMKGTMSGLIIAIPLSLLEGALRDRTGRLLDQMDVVASHLDHSASEEIRAAGIQGTAPVVTSGCRRDSRISETSNPPGISHAVEQRPPISSSTPSLPASPSESPRSISSNAHGTTNLPSASLPTRAPAAVDPALSSTAPLPAHPSFERASPLFGRGPSRWDERDDTFQDTEGDR
jgi:biopolymer transport protein ExbB/TolQ